MNRRDFLKSSSIAVAFSPLSIRVVSSKEVAPISLSNPKYFYFNLDMLKQFSPYRNECSIVRQWNIGITKMRNMAKDKPLCMVLRKNQHSPIYSLQYSSAVVELLEYPYCKVIKDRFGDFGNPESHEKVRYTL